MISLTINKATKGVAVFHRDNKAIASFPANLNSGKVPELEEVDVLCAEYVAPEKTAEQAEWEKFLVERKANFINQSQETIDSGKVDSKGRSIGYTVAVWQWKPTGQWYAVVQNARKNKKGEWEDFGVGQKGKKYSNEASAKAGGMMIAKERVRKL